MDFHNELDDIVEEESEFMYGGRDGLIFLVDASEPMFAKEEDKDADKPFKTCIECCKTFMLSKIISSNRDLVSIVLLGTSKSANELNAPNITTLQDLSEPSAVKIKQLEKMIETDDFDGFNEKFGHSNDYALSDALWLCQTIFATCASKLTSLRVLLLTNTSDPNVGNAVARRQALVRAVDLAHAGVSLELLHLSSEFNVTLFYKELLLLAHGGSAAGWEISDSSARIEELQERICRLNYKKRALCKLDLNLGCGVSLAVNLYNLIQKTAAPKKISLDRTSNEPLKSVVRYFSPDTQETMLPAELCKTQQFGERQVRFRYDEMRDLRAMVKPGLDLLGFKPASRVKSHHHTKPSAFIFPEEGLVQGSRALFSALLSRCAARQVVAVGYLTARTNATPKLVALVPQLEERNRDNSKQLLPPGFHVVYLPYADGIRKLNVSQGERASPAQVAKASAVINRLKFNYKPSLFDNPKLQVHWSNVEALALDSSEPRPVPDYTRPDLTSMGLKLGDLAGQLVRDVYPAGFEAGAPTPVRGKRPALPGGTAPSNPKQIKPEMPKEFGRSHALRLVSTCQAGKMTVAQLKKLLQEERIPFQPAAKKADLVALVDKHAKRFQS